MNNRVFAGLVHYPVYNKNREIITTSVTNLDIHDIARCIATYGVLRYYLITPLPSQHRLAQEIIDYWQQGFGASYNPDRKEALDLVALRESVEEVKAEIARDYHGSVYTVVTDASKHTSSVSFRAFRTILEEGCNKNFLLLFGTGWGLTQEAVDQADYILEPVSGRGGYNHLSVRSAVSIILDRILGEDWWRNGKASKNGNAKNIENYDNDE